MDCESFGKYLDNYENLTEQEKSDMDEHAAKCEECRSELDFFLSMISTVKSLPKAEPPSDFMDKLNARLDAEDKRVVSASGIIGHFRRYGIQYAAAAACLALVAVITANRSLLTGKMDSAPDGVIREETTVSDGSAHGGQSTPVPSTATSPIAADNGAQPSSAPEATPADSTAASRESADAPAVTPRASVPVSQPRTITPSAPVQRTSGAHAAAAQENVSTPAVTETPIAAPPQSSAPVSADVPGGAAVPVTEPKPENNGGADEPAPISNVPEDNGTQAMTRSVPDEYSAENTDEGQENNEDEYTIAYASVVGIPQTYDLRAEEVSESLKAAEIQANYSLADTGENDIAHGRYSKINNDGIPIESAKAVGSIKFSAEDEERAMEIINRYTVDEEDDIYITDSVNLTLILSRLRSESIPYTDYTIAGSGEVKFRIEFN